MREQVWIQLGRWSPLGKKGNWGWDKGVSIHPLTSASFLEGALTPSAHVAFTTFLLPTRPPELGVWISAISCCECHYLRVSFQGNRRISLCSWLLLPSSVSVVAQLLRIVSTHNSIGFLSYNYNLSCGTQPFSVMAMIKST